MKQPTQQFNFNEKVTPGYAIREIKSNEVIVDIASGRRASQYSDSNIFAY